VCKEATAAAPLDSKTPGAGELQGAPGIGPSTAEKPVQAINSSGTFKRVDDLRMRIRQPNPPPANDEEEQ
jgi:hypothetical protein